MYKMGLFETICFIATTEYALFYFNAERIVPTEKERKNPVMSWMWNM